VVVKSEKPHFKRLTPFGHVNFCQKHPNMLADVFIVCLGAKINHKKFQSDSSTPSWSKFADIFTMGITIENQAKN